MCHLHEVLIIMQVTIFVPRDLSLTELSALEVCVKAVVGFCLETFSEIKLMKGKALRKHSLHEKTAASVLLKLFISGNEWCHTTDAP